MTGVVRDLELRDHQGIIITGGERRMLERRDSSGAC